ncbi:MAG: plasmid pRiA4b ORF-3 family protein [Pseudomonadota bacterium]
MAKQAKKYQIKINLQGAKPPIWRRLWVAPDMTLGQLHDVIQTAMGWHDCHLHQFDVYGEYYSAPDQELGPDVSDEEDITLAAALQEPKQRITYEYDFGDGWVHEILLEKVLPREKQETLPICVKGKRACPPEDCGGVWGYGGLLEVLADPQHEQYEDMLEWVGDFDPEAFCVDSVNQKLAAYR